jgi:8-oxo-dGTP pyrophosphatase MutT (NUDIX family)
MLEPRFAPAQGFLDRARGVLLAAPLDAAEDEARFGDHAIDGLPAPPEFFRAAKPAAVLFPVVARPEGLSVLLTERARHLSTHAGQVAFPGGRIEPGESVEQAALRESLEEIGLEAAHARPVGFLPPFFSGTGYRVTPVMALLDPAMALQPDPGEVARVFEVPLAHVLHMPNYKRSSIFWRGRDRTFYVLDYDDAYIWGVTAGILHAFATRMGDRG